MLHRSKARLAVLAALALTAALPAAAIQAAAPATPAVADTSYNTNLLKNHSFGSGPVGDPIPHWTVKGDVFLETFGTHAFPSVAYGKKYKGGKHYLTCGRVSGSVTQTVPFSGTPMDGHGHHLLRARLQVDMGGVINNRIRLQVRALDANGDVIPTGTATKTKALTISYHYKQAVAALAIPDHTAQLEATIELLPPAAGGSCQIDADMAILVVMPIS